MPRDLFDQTLVSRTGPPRSKWTLTGSIILHGAIVLVLLVVPVLSALDEFVALADELTYVPPVMKAVPAAPAPPSRQTAAAPQLNREAAPLSAAANPVDEVPPDIPSGPPGPPDLTGLVRVGSGPGVPGGTGTNIGVAEREPPPPPPPPVPRRPGGDIKPPARTYYVEPVYSTIARAAGAEGYVILEATIDESGAVRNVTVLRSQHPLLTPAAVEAVSKWKYTPTRLNGVPIPIVMTVTVTFALR